MKKTPEQYGGEVLREHQVNVFNDTLEFINSDEHSSGYIELPTGTGKTVLFVELSRHALESKTLEAHSLPPKILVVVPRINLLRQTSGEGYEERGFKHFASDVAVSSYYGQEKDLSGDVVITTYQSFEKFMDAHRQLKLSKINERVKKVKEKLSIDNFGLIIFDEAHHMLSENKTRVLGEIPYEIKKLGLTATPETDAGELGDVFETKIHTMDLEEAIELELLSPVRLYALNSGLEIADIELDSQGDYKAESLLSIANDEKRNFIAAKVTANFVENDLQGVISCVRGDDILHAREMADLVSRLQITDQSGKSRFINAAWIGHLRSASENEKILQDFEKGFYDVLTYTDTLAEGWDSQVAKFLINARPTGSEKFAKQRLGRVLRRQTEIRPSYVVDIVDEIKEKPQVLGFDLLPSSTYRQGEIVKSSKTSDMGEIITELDSTPLPELAFRYTDYKQLLNYLEEKGLHKSNTQTYSIESHVYYGKRALNRRLSINERMYRWILENFGDEVITHPYIASGKVQAAIASEWIHDTLPSSDKVVETPNGIYRDENAVVWMSIDKIKDAFTKLNLKLSEDAIERFLNENPEYSRLSYIGQTERGKRQREEYEELIKAKAAIGEIIKRLKTDNL